MKRTILLLQLIIIMFSININTVNAQNTMINTEEDLLKSIVKETFVNGALNDLNTEAMNKGFHKDFAILIAQDNSLFRLYLKDWIKVINQYKNSEEQLQSKIRELDYTIDILDITGKTAIVKTEFFRKNNIVITDYLSFIKFPEGWKAVGKISHEHVSNPLNLQL